MDRIGPEAAESDAGYVQDRRANQREMMEILRGIKRDSEETRGVLTIALGIDFHNPFLSAKAAADALSKLSTIASKIDAVEILIRDSARWGVKVATLGFVFGLGIIVVLGKLLMDSGAVIEIGKPLGG